VFHKYGDQYFLEQIWLRGDLERTQLPESLSLGRSLGEGIQAGTLRASVAGEDMLLGGDILLEINGTPVTVDGTLDQIYANLSRLKSGEKLTSKVLRAGQVIELSTVITSQ